MPLTCSPLSCSCGLLWKVGSVDFRDAGDGRRERVWRHPGFFRYKAFIRAGVPRVTCPVHGVGTVPVPWARPGGGFTLLFGAWAVELARRLPAGTLAEQLDETDTRLWWFISHYVDEAMRLEDCTGGGGRRHRRDQPQGPRLHHRGRRSGRARHDRRDARQGLGHGRTVHAGFHGPRRCPGVCASGRLRHEPRVSGRASAGICPMRGGSSTGSM